MESKDEVEVDVKFNILPFPIKLTITAAEYLMILKVYEYQGFAIEAILVQYVGEHEIWATKHDRFKIDLTFSREEEHEEEDTNV
jgi:hypothetical protein